MYDTKKKVHIDNICSIGWYTLLVLELRFEQKNICMYTQKQSQADKQKITCDEEEEEKNHSRKNEENFLLLRLCQILFSNIKGETVQNNG